MKVIGRKILEEACKKHTDTEQQLKSWLFETENATWDSFHSVKKRYRSASNIGDNKVIFNIKGNKYRLEVKIFYLRGIVLIERFGTHAEYDRW